MKWVYHYFNYETGTSEVYSSLAKVCHHLKIEDPTLLKSMTRSLREKGQRRVAIDQNSYLEKMYLY